MIRRTVAADLDQVLAIEARSHQQPWTRAHFEAELPGALFFIDADQRAFIVCWMVAGELQIQNIATDPVHRQRGLARALLLHALAFPHDLATLEVCEGNNAALRLYESVGFVRVGKRAAYYSNGDAALLLNRVNA